MSPRVTWRIGLGVGPEEYGDAALVVVGHGSTQDAESGAPVYQQAAELRRRRLFAQVREAFWGQEPTLATVIGELTERRIFIAPLFISEGYIAEQRIPSSLGFSWAEAGKLIRVRQRDARSLYYCRPVGTHSSMTQLILSHAQAVVAQYPFPRPPRIEETALFIAGHGTNKDENSRRAIEQHVAGIEACAAYAFVQAIFLEEAPRIGECYPLAPVNHLIVVPFFISEGPHVRQDIPIGLGEPLTLVEKRLQQNQPAWRNPTERNGKRVWLSASIGRDPHLADVILERVKEISDATKP